MNYMKRIKNAYKTGGIREICRKLYYREIYKFHGQKAKRKVIKSKYEFGLYQENKRKEKIVVSLTSYPKRFKSIDLCLKSLILQSVKPDMIIVYLGCDSDEKELPHCMEKYKKYGIDFVFDKTENLKSHKKYYYAMRDYPNAIVVTADDDIIYPSDWLASLVASYHKYPNAVSARRVHLIRFDDNKNILPYNNWKDQYRKCTIPSKSLIAIGNGGILYPPNCLDKRVFEVENLKKLCFDADDIWLKCMEILNDTKVVWVKNNMVDPPEVDGTSKSALYNTNVGANKNDTYLKNLMEFYRISPSDFI